MKWTSNAIWRSRCCHLPLEFSQGIIDFLISTQGTSFQEIWMSMVTRLQIINIYLKCLKSLSYEDLKNILYMHQINSEKKVVLAFLFKQSYQLPVFNCFQDMKYFCLQSEKTPQIFLFICWNYSHILTLAMQVPSYDVFDFIVLSADTVIYWFVPGI